MEKNGNGDSSGVSEVFPIVGIGVSAFEEFFSEMVADPDPGMAFVLVQHLLPDHNSMLTDLLGRHRRVRVRAVRDAMVVRPNCAYIIRAANLSVTPVWPGLAGGRQTPLYPVVFERVSHTGKEDRDGRSRLRFRCRIMPGRS